MKKMMKRNGNNMSARFDYRCEEHGEIEISHGLAVNRREMPCPCCGVFMKPLISKGVGMKLTGRPAWAYNDIINAAKSNNGNINKNTVISDDREGSNTQGKKMKMNNTMGNYNAQW